MKRHSLKSNCEQDFDSSLLQNVHKFFAANQNSDGLGADGADRNSDELDEIQNSKKMMIQFAL